MLTNPFKRQEMSPTSNVKTPNSPNLHDSTVSDIGCSVPLSEIFERFSSRNQLIAFNVPNRFNIDLLSKTTLSMTGVAPVNSRRLHKNSSKYSCPISLTFACENDVRLVQLSAAQLRIDLKVKTMFFRKAQSAVARSKMKRSQLYRDKNSCSDTVAPNPTNLENPVLTTPPLTDHLDDPAHSPLPSQVTAPEVDLDAIVDQSQPFNTGSISFSPIELTESESHQSVTSPEPTKIVESPCSDDPIHSRIDYISHRLPGSPPNNCADNPGSVTINLQACPNNNGLKPSKKKSHSAQN